MVSSAALAGIRVVDFSSLLPGPLCTLMLAEAGADVIKIERPGIGDEMRSYTPRFGEDSVNFALLNRGKEFLALDLKSPEGFARAVELVKTADVVVEQFRPGVMDRLGLGYEALSELNPRIVYCSISGWGQSGPLANVAAHDLNYQAETGLLSLTADGTGAPQLPNILAADIAGGAYPAVINILLALRAREPSGKGQYIDISMSDNLFPFVYWGLGKGFSEGDWPAAGSDLVTGESPRYQIYRTRDGRYLAAAPLEQKFWENFLRILEIPHLLHERNAREVKRTVASIVATRTSDEWEQRFSGVDACVTVVKSLRESVDHPHFRQRGLFNRYIEASDGQRIPALPMPISPGLRRKEGC